MTTQPQSFIPTKRALLDYEGYVFDLDGTLYLGPVLIEGIAPMLENLRSLDKAIRFLSNKPLQTRQDYAAKLRSLGVDAEDDQVINSSAVVTRYLLDHHSGCRPYVLGEAPLLGELVAAGFSLATCSADCDLLLLSFDRDFSYRKLHEAMLAAKTGVPIIATNPDVTCPTESGEIPDCGAIIAAVEACSGREVDVIVGKPSRIMMEVILKDLGLPAGEVLLVGDRLETDMKMGLDAGMATALVLTGVTSPQAAAGCPAQPDYILASAAAIAP